MKTILRLVTLSIFFIFSASAYSQCENLTITLSTQAQIDAFSANYPGCSTFANININSGSQQPFITNLDGLSQVTTILHNLLIDNEPYGNNAYSLISIAGLSNITSIGGDLRIKHIPLVQGNIFENLLSIGGELYVSHNLPSVLHGFHNLNTIGERLTIQSTTLNGVNAFGQLTHIGVGYELAQLIITDNPTLSYINGFSLLEYSGNISFLNTPELENLPNLWGLTDESTTTLSIQTTGIGNLNGLINLTHLKRLIILQNPSLVDFEGINSLTSITSDMQIRENPQLNDISDLSSLTSLGSLQIEYSPGLSSLMGLHNLNPATFNSVFLRHNPNLAECAISPFCAKIAMGGIGSFFVQDNGPSCNNGNEIAAACQMLNVDNQVFESTFMYPNPVGNILYIFSEEQVLEWMISNTAGQILSIGNQRIIDVSSLSPGLYFVNIKTTTGTVVAKVIKL
ncbi:MAG: T9SS type A sorting domain-containing protein [Flavobacterium sp.]|nr:T9SS type A sorting domain-containing protein [Flavobacterium sp.]